MANIELTRRMAGCDPHADNPVLEACLEAAAGWYAEAGVPPQADNAQYSYYVASLAAWMYDNRGDSESTKQIPAYIIASLHTLRPIEAAGGAGA